MAIIRDKTPPIKPHLIFVFNDEVNEPSKPLATDLIKDVSMPERVKTVKTPVIDNIYL